MCSLVDFNPFCLMIKIRETQFIFPKIFVILFCIICLLFFKEEKAKIVWAFLKK